MTRYRYLFLLLVSLLVWQNAAAQSEKWGLPPSPNGKLVSALLDAINETDTEIHRKFIESHFTPAFIKAMPMELHLNAFQQMHQDLAGTQVNGVEMMMGATARLKIQMETQAEDYFNLLVELATGNPPQIAGLHVEESLDGPPAGKQMVDAILDVINESDAEVHRKFIDTYFAPAFKHDLPMEKHLELLQQMHKDLAGATVEGVDAMSRGSSDETVTMALVTKAGARFTLTFDMQLSSPPRLITLNVAPE